MNAEKADAGEEKELEKRVKKRWSGMAAGHQLGRKTDLILRHVTSANAFNSLSCSFLNCALGTTASSYSGIRMKTETVHIRGSRAQHVKAWILD